MHEDNNRFDAEFFRRYYGDPQTRVADEDDAERIAGLIGGIVRYMELPVRSILDAGCGIGMLRELMAIRQNDAKGFYSPAGAGHALAPLASSSPVLE